MNRLLATAVLALSLAPAHALSLRAAATEAAQHDPRVRAISAEIAATEADVALAAASNRPSVGFSGDIGRSDLRTRARFPQSGARVPNSVGIAATLPLYTSGRTAALDDAAKRGVEAALESRRDIGGKIVLAALTAYMDAKRERETLRLVQATLATLNSARNDVNKRFNAGEATRTDVSQADARIAEGAANLVRAKTQMLATELELQRLLGRVPADLDAPWPTGLLLAQSREAAIQLSKTAPAVASARHSSEAALAQIRATAAEGGPQVSLDAHAGTQDNTEFGYDRQSTWALQLKFSAPLYTGGRQPAKEAHARAKAIASTYMAEDEAAYFAQTAAAEWEVLQASEQIISAIQSQQKAAELTLDGVQKELKVGTRTSLDLLDAQRDLLAAQVNLVSAYHDRAVTQFRLMAACGTLELFNLPD